MVSNFIEKEKTSSSRGPLLLLYIGFLLICAFIVALVAGLLWASNALDFLGYLMNPESSRFAETSRISEAYPYDGLTLVVISIGMIAYTLLLGLSVWMFGAVLAFARGTMRGYQTVLTISVALPILSFIFLKGFELK